MIRHNINVLINPVIENFNAFGNDFQLLGGIQNIVLVCFFIDLDHDSTTDGQQRRDNKRNRDNLEFSLYAIKSDLISIVLILYCRNNYSSSHSTTYTQSR